MKTHLKSNITRMLLLCVAFAIGGCYTVLMHPSVLTSTEQEYPAQSTSVGDYTSEISYSQNCLSCHSQTELDDRYFDMQKAGMQYAHGMSIDPYGWRAPSVSVPWWIGVYAPIPQSGVAGVPASGSDKGSRRRDSGSSRGSDRSRPNDNTNASSPTTTTTTTVAAPEPAAGTGTSSGTTTSTGSTSTSPERTKTSTPAAEPAPRKSGSSRGNDPK